MKGILIGEKIRRIARGTLPRPLYFGGARILDGWYASQKFGFREYRNLYSIGKGTAGDPIVEVHLPNLNHPLYLRPGTPDASVIVHAMAREAYAYRLPPGPVKFIIDAGANIGDTSVWYATRYPAASVVAIEPNPENLAILTRNCAYYGDRIRVLNAALWPASDRNLAVHGELAGASVSESRGDGPTCPSIDPMTLLRNSGHETIDIFKIDIEGAELGLFSGKCDEWLARTRCIAMEIHSPEAREAVLLATRRNGFKDAVYRDLHVFWR